MTQGDLARAANVAQTTISMIEIGERPANTATRKKIAKALGVKPVDLFMISGDFERN